MLKNVYHKVDKVLDLLGLSNHILAVERKRAI